MKGVKDFEARRVRISSFCDKDPSLPECMLDHTPDHSRMLDVMEQKYQDNREVMERAISFTKYAKENNHDQ